MPEGRVRVWVLIHTPHTPLLRVLSLDHDSIDYSLSSAARTSTLHHPVSRQDDWFNARAQAASSFGIAFAIPIPGRKVSGYGIKCAGWSLTSTHLPG